MDEENEIDYEFKKGPITNPPIAFYRLRRAYVNGYNKGWNSGFYCGIVTLFVIIGVIALIFFSFNLFLLSF